jgi:FMN phosphatase YigB (HAD superfamily)
VKIVLFDLGYTLEHDLENKHVTMPGALKLLSAITEMLDQNGKSPVLALVSDFDRPAAEYYRIIEGLQIDKFFKPYPERITLSKDIGYIKPDKRFFRAAIDKIHIDLPFQNVIFVTENKYHITEARKLGMMTLRLKIPNDLEEGVDSLPEMIPFIHLFILI